MKRYKSIIFSLLGMTSALPITQPTEMTHVDSLMVSMTQLSAELDLQRAIGTISNIIELLSGTSLNTAVPRDLIPEAQTEQAPQKQQKSTDASLILENETSPEQPAQEPSVPLTEPPETQQKREETSENQMPPEQTIQELPEPATSNETRQKPDETPENQMPSEQPAQDPPMESKEPVETLQKTEVVPETPALGGGSGKCTSYRKLFTSDDQLLVGVHKLGADNVELFNYYETQEEGNCVSADIWGFFFNAGYLDTNTGRIINEAESGAMRKAMMKGKHIEILFEPRADAGDEMWMWKKMKPGSWDEDFWTSFLSEMKKIADGSDKTFYFRILHEANNPWTCYQWNYIGPPPPEASWCGQKTWFWADVDGFSGPDDVSKRRAHVGEIWSNLKRIGNKIGFTNLNVVQSFDANDWTVDENAVGRGVGEVRAFGESDSVGADMYTYTHGDEDAALRRFGSVAQELGLGRKLLLTEVGSEHGSRTCDIVKTAQENNLGAVIMWTGGCSGGKDCTFDWTLQC